MPTPTGATEAHFFPQNSVAGEAELDSWGNQLQICEPNLIPVEKNEPPWLPYTPWAVAGPHGQLAITVFRKRLLSVELPWNKNL